MLLLLVNYAAQPPAQFVVQPEGDVETEEFVGRNRPGGTPYAPDSECGQLRGDAAISRRGEIDAVFRRAAGLTQLKPRVLSRRPWVIVFDDFVGPAQASALIARTEPELDRGIHGHGYSDERTSRSAFCRADCSADADVAKLDARIADVTGTPLPHTEYLQVVRYTEDQRYAEHHDQSHHAAALSGVRLFTVLLYLRAPDEGGETVFTALNLSVTPRAGRALFWTNVRDADPRATEPRVMHEALPVRRGVKWAANAWVHRQSWRPAVDAGCFTETLVAGDANCGYEDPFQA